MAMSAAKQPPPPHGRLTFMRTAGEVAAAGPRPATPSDAEMLSDAEMVVQVNMAGLVIAASPMTTRWLDPAPGQLLGAPIAGLIHPDDLGFIDNALGRHGAEPAVSAPTWCRGRRRDGAWQWCLGRATPLTLAAGDPMALVTLCPATPSRMGEHVSPDAVTAGTHVVQFYETDQVLVDALSRFVRSALAAGDACLVLATPPHRARLAGALRGQGVDLCGARQRGLYRALDAAATLDAIMVEGTPDPVRFARVIGHAIARAARRGRTVRVFGELVALLWLAGNEGAAVRLEELWEDILRPGIPPVTLFCAYPIHGFVADTPPTALSAIRALHEGELPGQPAAAPAPLDARTHALAEMRQEAHSLRGEIARRQLAEARLRLSEERYRRLFEASPDGMLLIDPGTGRVEEANHAAMALLAGITDHVRGSVLRDLDLFADRDAADMALRALREHHVFHEHSLSIPSLGGETRYATFDAHLVVVDGKDAVLGTLRDVTDRKRLERDTAERAAELEAIQAVSDVALAQSSLDDLLRHLLERLRAILAVDNVAILLPDAEARDLRTYLAHGPEEEVAGQARVPIGEGVAGRIAATREALVIDDLRTARVANPFLRERLRSLMGVPLVVGDRLIGVVHAATVGPHQFTEHELRVLRLVADRMALAIDRAHAHEEARAAHRDALERAEHLNATIEAIADGVVVFNHEGRLAQMNATAQRLLGYTAQPDYALMPDRTVRPVRDEHGRDVPPNALPVNRVLRGEVITGAHAVELVIQTAAGQDVRVSVSGAPIRQADGAVAGAVCVFRDVTEQRRLERRTHEALSTVLEMAGALVDLPAEGEANPAPGETAATSAGRPIPWRIAHRLAELTRGVLDCRRVGIAAVDPEAGWQTPIAVVGLSPEQETRWWTEQFGHPTRYGEGVDPALLARFEAGEALVVDMTEPPYNTLPNPCGLTTTLVAPMRVGACVIGSLSLDYGGPPHVFTDQERALAEAAAQLAALVLEREQLLSEREVARANALAAQEATRRMNTFLGIAGHELRTPVTSMKASVQLTARAVDAALRGDVPDVAARPLERGMVLLARADQQANRLSRLIEDILDVTRTQAGKLALRAEPGDLTEVVRRAVEEQRLAWPARTITLRAPRAPVRLVFDPDRIEQVVINYVTNACKYSAADRPIAVEVTSETATARVAVRDEGPGLSPEMRVHIWEAFHQVAGVAQQNGSSVGLGLGLHICRSLIERHGGRVGVDSIEGAGSTFWFELPAGAASGSSASAPEDSAMEGAHGQTDGKTTGEPALASEQARKRNP